MQLLLHANAYDVKAYASADSLLCDPDMHDTECLIIACRLDKTDGISVLQRLRESGWNGPALLVTAFGSAELTEQAAATGFCEVLEKPCKERELVNAVARHIGASSDAGRLSL